MHRYFAASRTETVAYMAVLAHLGLLAISLF